MRKNDLLILFVFSIVWLCKPISYQDLVRNQLIREKTVVTNLNFKGGDQDSIGKSTTGRKILLEKLFPDWFDRVDFQKKQQKFYKSARAKLREARKPGISDKSAVKLLTVQEKDALDYFNGTGSYEKYQNPKTLPNIFDTRQSFLLKMNNREMRTNFLNSYNLKRKTNSTVD